MMDETSKKPIWMKLAIITLLPALYAFLQPIFFVTFYATLGLEKAVWITGFVYHPLFLFCDVCEPFESICVVYIEWARTFLLIQERIHIRL